MRRPNSRSRWLALGLLCGMSVAGPSRAAEPEAARRWQVVVRETAGIRRFSYPVQAYFDVGAPLPDVTRLRLLEQGKPVAAQFSAYDARGFTLYFNASHLPLESRTYTVEYDPRGRPAPRPKPGVQVLAEGDVFRVVHSAGLEFVVPRNLLGLLRQVKTRQTEYLRPGSAGLMIRYKDDIDFRAGGFGPDGVPTVAKVVAAGPLAAVLRFEGTEALRGGRSVRSRVEMEFPLSKSWVRVTWTVDDPQRYVAGLGADLNLRAGDGPTLVDLGAGTYVYARLRAGEAAVLRQRGDAWQTLLGPAGRLTPYVVGRASSVEGWAHVMDSQRCTAVAVADFAGWGSAEMEAGADGRLRLWNFGTSRLQFWLHFVPMPVHIGAATSPQAMLAPLEVTVKEK